LTCPLSPPQHKSDRTLYRLRFAHAKDPDIPPRIREIFSKLDEDNSGYLESAEIGRILQMMGITDSEERDDQVRNSSMHVARHD